MRRYTQKELRELVREGLAVDVTRATCADADRIRQAERYLQQVGYSAGVYGCNGQLFLGAQSGTLYAVTARGGVYTF